MDVSSCSVDMELDPAGRRLEETDPGDVMNIHSLHPFRLLLGCRGAVVKGGEEREWTKQVVPVGTVGSWHLLASPGTDATVIKRF
jgi:hypothetical protein